MNPTKDQIGDSAKKVIHAGRAQAWTAEEQRPDTNKWPREKATGIGTATGRGKPFARGSRRETGRKKAPAEAAVMTTTSKTTKTRTEGPMPKTKSPKTGTKTKTKDPTTTTSTKKPPTGY